MGMLHEYSPEERAVIAPQAITIRPLARPLFDNSRLANEALWFLDNARALASYWTACGNALGLSTPNSVDEEEFNLWLRHQWLTEKRNV